MAKERVQKILAKAGIASRRKAEDLIREGQVTINGKIASIGDHAILGTDSIKVSGKLIQKAEPPVYVAFYKPRNVISMLGDPEGRPSLLDYTSQVKTRIFPVGRLDFTSEGLLLMTNDGDFAEKFQKRDDIPRVFHVKVKGHPEPEMLKRLTRGMRIEGKKIKPHSVSVVQDLEKKTKIQIVFLESGAIDVRALFEMTGYLFERITRVSLGHLTLRGLKPGEMRHLKASQIYALLEQPELGMRLLDQSLGDEESQARSADRRAAKFGFGEDGMKIKRDPAAGPGPRIAPKVNPKITPRSPRESRDARDIRSPISPRPSFGDKNPGFKRKTAYGVFEESAPKETRRSKFRDAEKREASYGDSPIGSKSSFGKKSAFGGKKPFGAKKSFGAKPAFGKPAFGDKKRDSSGKSMQDFRGFRKEGDERTRRGSPSAGSDTRGGFAKKRGRPSR